MNVRRRARFLNGPEPRTAPTISSTIRSFWSEFRRSALGLTMIAVPDAAGRDPGGGGTAFQRGASIHDDTVPPWPCACWYPAAHADTTGRRPRRRRARRRAFPMATDHYDNAFHTDLDPREDYAGYLRLDRLLSAQRDRK